MRDAIIVGLISGAFGIAIAYVPFHFAAKRAPSRLTTDAIALIDANGIVRSNLTEEIDRLEAKALRAEERASRAEEKARKLELRVVSLESAMRHAGLDPAAVK